MLQGFLPIHKPEGITSHDVVNRVRRILHVRRIGHTGTLDPIATGVLVLCVGEVTRLAEYLAGHAKVYRTRIRLGITTDTLDRTGHIVSTAHAAAVDEAMVRSILPRFVGRIQQVPPMLSARRFHGKRLYELARAGCEVERTPQEVTIARLDLLAFEPGEHPAVLLEVECSAGTYIRALAADIGSALGVGGMMEDLVRTQVGSVRLDDCLTLEELEEMPASALAHRALKPATWVLRDWPCMVATPEEVDLLRHGRQVVRPEAIPQDGLALVIGHDGGLVAVARANGRQIQPVKVFGAEDTARALPRRQGE